MRGEVHQKKKSTIRRCDGIHFGAQRFRFCTPYSETKFRLLYRCTDTHPFWMEKGGDDGEGGFLAARSLRVGDQLRLGDGSPAYVTGVEATGIIEPVYNFSVDGWHTYHVGELGVWVHNANCFEKNFGPMMRSVSDDTLSSIQTSFYSGAKSIKATMGKVGNGGLGDAIRYEKGTGNLLSTSGHEIKGQQALRRLNKWITRTENASSNVVSKADYDFAVSLREDLLRALRF